VLLFTSSNWSTPQTVTVWAYDDNVLETDPHIGAICHYVSSSDPNFNNIPLPAVSVTVWENECDFIILTSTTIARLTSKTLQS
jgi:hypothetical protein